MKEDMSLSNLVTVALHAAEVPTNMFSSTLICILTLDYRWFINFEVPQQMFWLRSEIINDSFSS